MSTDAWVTAAFLVVMIVVLVTERFPPLMVIAGTVIGLLVAGVLDDDAAFAGLSNTAVVTVASLYVLAGAIDITGALEGFTRRTFTENPDASERRALAQFLVPTTMLSSVVANTPLVSVMIPRVLAWCRRTGRSPSKYLMPLSYVAVLGGVITLIGTSTNLVVASLLDEQGRDGLDLFDLTPVGLPVAIVGTLVVVLFASKLVPNGWRRPTPPRPRVASSPSTWWWLPAATSTVAPSGMPDCEHSRECSWRPSNTRTASRSTSAPTRCWPATTG